MLITQITTWEGTPAAIEAVVAGSREAAPIHEGLGAKNPRLMRSVSGGDVYQGEYMIDFDSFEAQGKFSDAIVDGEWWTGMMQAVAAAYPDLRNAGTRLTYNAI
ncbi:MAG: hypothetical protein VXW59_03850 [Actinomycetota bacterium]|nr:hypothetical protein [Actinomycetota bacterium]